MAKEKKVDIAKEIQEFTEFLLTPQDKIEKTYTKKMFGASSDNFLINDYLETAGYNNPYNFRAKLRRPEFATRYNSKDIKAIEEALYLAKNNPILNKIGRGDMFDDFPKSKSVNIHSRYLSDNIGDITNTYKNLLDGNISKDEATKNINNILSQSAPNDLSRIVRDTSNPLKFSEQGYIVDAFPGRQDIYNILGSIDPQFKDMPKEIFATSGRDEEPGAMQTKAENIVRLLASFGYDKQQIVDALADTKSPLVVDYTRDRINELIGQRVVTGREEYTQEPVRTDVAPVVMEGRDTPVTPGYTYFGAGEGSPLGYINPAGERVDITEDFFNEQRLKELAQAGTPAIEEGGKLIYDRPVYETIDDKEFSYKMSPGILKLISENPNVAKYFNLTGIEPVDYSRPIYSIPIQEKANGGKVGYATGKVAKLLTNFKPKTTSMTKRRTASITGEKYPPLTAHQLGMIAAGASLADSTQGFTESPKFSNTIFYQDPYQLGVFAAEQKITLDEAIQQINEFENKLKKTGQSIIKKPQKYFFDVKQGYQDTIKKEEALKNIELYGNPEGPGELIPESGEIKPVSFFFKSGGLTKLVQKKLNK
mgnify:CR=1 FL=1|tara:strand:- start:164 stop:1942 length:1779 start_codon:yes stop_codon:yes gene_type:complete